MHPDLRSDMVTLEIHNLQSNDYADWDDFVSYQSLDPYDDFGWFHLTIGIEGQVGGNDFQVCVATPKSIGRVQRSGSTPGIIVDQFDATSVRSAIIDRIESIKAYSWDQVVDQLRLFMHWEYEGM